VTMTSLSVIFSRFSRIRALCQSSWVNRLSNLVLGRFTHDRHPINPAL
jgi:hypothetical protein